jgi:hypothetical protein
MYRSMIFDAVRDEGHTCVARKFAPGGSGGGGLIESP